MYNNSSTDYPYDDYDPIGDIREFLNSELNDSQWTPMNIVSIIFLGLTCILGVPGNAFVIWIAGFKMKRTVNNVFFTNLAVADFFCCLSIPFTIAEIAMNYHWPYGNLMCKFIPTIVLLSMFASVFTLVLVSMDRCLLVIKPIWSQTHRTISLGVLLCGTVWFLSLFLCLPSIIYRSVSDNMLFNRSTCSLTDSVPQRTYIVRFLTGFLLPLFVIALCYILLVRRVSSSRFTKSRRTIRIILSVVAAFFICWLPYHVVGLMLVSGEKTAHQAGILEPLSIALAYLNSCLNPVLYVFIGQDFKDKVKLSIRRAFERAFSEAGTSTINSKGDLSRATNSSEAHL